MELGQKNMFMQKNMGLLHRPMNKEAPEICEAINDPDSHSALFHLTPVGGLGSIPLDNMEWRKANYPCTKPNGKCELKIEPNKDILYNDEEIQVDEYDLPILDIGESDLSSPSWEDMDFAELLDESDMQSGDMWNHQSETKLARKSIT